MIEINRPRDLARLRRLALSAQGLLMSTPYGRGVSGAREAINKLGYVQIDSISVVERAHHHVLYTRVPDFKPETLSRMLLDRDIFEYWTHAAAFLPISDFRFSLPYKQAIKTGQTHWYRNPDKKLMRELLARIRSDGPIRSRDLDKGSSKPGTWWNWKPAKKALEQLYMEGELMVSNRDGFQKTYDLTERVLPATVKTQTPTIEEFSEHLLNQQLRCHGVISITGLTYQRRNPELRKKVKQLVNERLSQGSLQQVKVNHTETFIIESGKLEETTPRIKNRLLILSPFDNAVIQRDRLKSLFQYDYQLECYLPASKRKYGYFSLPLLYRDEFIGRMDCKVYRENNLLEIKLLQFDHQQWDMDSVSASFSKAIKKFCVFQGCSSVSLKKVHPTNITKNFRRSLEFLN